MSCGSFDRCQSWIVSVVAVSLLGSAALVNADDRQPVSGPNYRQAAQFSSRYVRQFLYDTSVTPRWIGKTDEFWYSFRTSEGTNFYRVDPKSETKKPLFDRVKLGGQLAAMLKKPLDPTQLSLSRGRINDEGTEFSFVVDNIQYKYDLAAEALTKVGKAAAQTTTPSRGRFRSREEFERYRQEILRQQEQQRQEREREEQKQKEEEKEQEKKNEEKEEKKGDEKVDDKKDTEEKKDEEKKDEDEKKDTEEDNQRGATGSSTGARGGTDHRAFSPDRKMYVFAKNHNLYLVEYTDEQLKKAMPKEKKKEEEKDGEKTEEGKDDEKKDGDKEDGDKEDGDKKDGDKEDGDKEEKQEEQKGEESTDAEESTEPKPLPIPKRDPQMDEGAVQLTTDGEENYSFGGRSSFSGRGGTQTTTQTTPDPNRKTRPSVSWSEDSKSFYVSRRDSRGVKELWVINSLSDPRPTLQKYAYPMPGDENIRKSQLYVFSREAKKLTRVEPKWIDESYSNTHFGKDGNKLRFLRRDRLLRNAEFCELDIAKGKATCMVEEGFENANLVTQNIRYLDETDEMIWWSERSGWGHFYLYGRDGKLKNAITSGPYRASRVVDIDTKNRLMYFTGNAREPGENVYLQHLYCVHLDGTGLTLLDPGNANHRSTLSPTKQFLVDNCSRIDMSPVSILRDAHGRTIMELEKADLSRLAEVGWQLPETFSVKAADGVTDLYGNMWKPFDFDPNKKYPIIAHVYPGPQSEGTSHTFSATAGEQQLAQVGFIVIQVGHRGGTPNRGKAYAAYGYFNLRDYGLADKKAAIEQLAARYPFIDIGKVGLYGHSGGGFMTAAAMLQKPYNDFFKVGVATAGNHDNNIYNNSWSERYHGLKEVAVAEESQTSGRGRGGVGGRGGSGVRGRGGVGTGGRGGGTRGTGASHEFQVEASDYFYENEYLWDDESVDWEELLHWIESSPETPLMFQDQKSNDTQDNQDDTKKDDAQKDDTKKDDAQKDDAQIKAEKRKARREERKKKAAAQDATQGKSTQGDAQKSDATDDAKTDQSDKQQSNKQKKQEVKKDGKSDEKEKEETEQKKELKTDEKKDGEKGKEKEDEVNKEEKKDEKKDEEKDKEEEKESDQKKTKFEIKVPTNIELAPNLKGHLLLVHGESDNNVHPANTLRLVDALIKANKRFDMLYLPGKRHSFGEYQPYVTQRMYEYFAEHLLDDYQEGADINSKNPPSGR